MTDQFGRYEQDLLEVIKSAKIKLADKIPIAEKEEKKTLIRQCTKEIDDMNSIIGDMEFEISKSGPNSRSSMNTRLKQYRLDVEIVQKELKKATNETNKIKSYDNLAYANQNMDPERRKVLQIHNSLKNAGDSIVRSTQIAIETEELGNNVLGELNDQGEKLRNTNTRLDDTNAAVSKSRRLINKLSNGVIYNKILLVVIIILEIAILCGVIYWKFLRR